MRITNLLGNPLSFISTFEILEISYDVTGNIQAFAANFIQKCETTLPPLFGSIRYRSSVPIEARFAEVFDSTSESSFYAIRYNPCL